MTFKEYDAGAAKTDRSSGTYEYYALGLTGESGEVAEHVKKYLRTGPHHKPIDPHAVMLELGDVLYYISRFANRLGYSLEHVAEMNSNKLAERYNIAR